MESFEARALVAEAQRLRERARADQRLAFDPLIAFGIVVFGGGVIRFLETPRFGPGDVNGDVGVSFGWYDAGQLYWLVVPPLALVLLAVIHRSRARQLGVQPIAAGALGWITAGVLIVSIVLFLPFPHESLPLALGLIALAVVRRDWYLGWWMAGLGVISLLLDTGFWNNRLYELIRWRHEYQDTNYGYVEWADLATTAAFVVLVGGAAWGAWRRAHR